MIARIWRGVTRAADAERYLEYLRATGFAEYRATQGNLGILALRREPVDRAEFLLVSLWDSWDAIRRFAGDDLEQAVFYPEDDRYLIEKDQEVDHFDVVILDWKSPPDRWQLIGFR